MFDAVMFEQCRWNSALRLREECSPAQLRAAAKTLLMHGATLPVVISVCCEQSCPFIISHNVLLLCVITTVDSGSYDGKRG